MNIPIPLRWRKAIALGLVSLPAQAIAADPAPFPIPSARTTRDIEIFYGTTKVWPIYRPAPVPVMPAEGKGWAGAPIQPPAPITPPAPKEEPKPAPIIESRTIILAGYAGPFSQHQPNFYPHSAPWLAVPPPMIPQMPAPQHIPAVPQQQTQPTIVVIREPSGEPRPVLAAPAESRGVTIGNEMLLGIGIGVAGLGFGFAGWRRRAAVAGTKAGSPLPFSPMGGDGMLLMGKYNAGPCPTSAEKFDLGPSYQVQQQEKKKTEEQNQQAVLEFILNQNLALHAELGGTSDDLPEAAELDTEKN